MKIFQKTVTRLPSLALYCIFVLNVFDASLISKPVDTVVLEGQWTLMNCSSDFFNTYSPDIVINWYNSSQCMSNSSCPNGSTIYSSGSVHASSRFIVSNVSRSNNESIRNLAINQTQLGDAATYVCHDLDEKTTNNVAAAQLIVLANTPNCTVNTTLSLSSDIVSLTCSILYNGHLNASLVFVDDFDKEITSGNGAVTNISSSTGTTLHCVLNTMTTYATSTRCLAKFGLISSIIPGRCPNVAVAETPGRITINTIQEQYAVGETIECMASGFPKPSYIWKDLSSENIINGSVLTISSSMLGHNFTFQCIAMNIINGQEYSTLSNVSFVVQGYATTTKSSAFSSTAGHIDNNNTPIIVGVVVGVGGALVILAIVLLVCCCRCRNRKQRKQDRPAANDNRQTNGSASNGSAAVYAQVNKDKNNESPYSEVSNPNPIEPALYGTTGDSSTYAPVTAFTVVPPRDRPKPQPANEGTYAPIDHRLMAGSAAGNP